MPRLQRGAEASWIAITTADFACTRTAQKQHPNGDVGHPIHCVMLVHGIDFLAGMEIVRH